MDIRSDRQKGLSYTELGKKNHMDPRTAKRYAESPERPEYTLSAPKPTKMDQFKPMVDEWLETPTPENITKSTTTTTDTTQQGGTTQ